ncbi:hypothetical protein [Clostridium botulinum]|uniref:hypothetical protein n=1 Tax=Clostridium botulinum TaxID=1491 RepID=UPI001E523599|nr:hypothetical protein [Clostridium botulinum]MCD3223972.1 hypothetical protein [Clostridium botulinum C/D]
MNRESTLATMEALRNDFVATIGQHLKDINNKINICKIHGIIDDKNDIQYALDKIQALTCDFEKMEAMDFTCYADIEQYEEYSTRFTQNNNKMSKFLEFYVEENQSKLN